MAGKGNGSGLNDQDPDKEAAGKLIRFPSNATRSRRRSQKKQEDLWREQYGSKNRRSKPFFNFSRIPVFTRIIVVTLIAVHIVLHLALSGPALYQVFYTLGFVPGYFTGRMAEFPFLAVLSPLTYIFIHGGWVHLLFNAMMALVMGMFFEKEFGIRTTAFFFFACGLAGAALYFLMAPFSTTPVIGASGSISGLFGAMTIIMFQRRPLSRIGGARITKYGPWPLVLFWVLFMILIGSVGGEAMAWQTHVGGFLAGIGFLLLMQKGKLRFR